MGICFSSPTGVVLTEAERKTCGTILPDKEAQILRTLMQYVSSPAHWYDATPTVAKETLVYIRAGKDVR